MSEKEFKEPVTLLCGDYSPDREEWKLVAEKLAATPPENLVTRLTRRAEIRRKISTHKSVQEGKPDRISDLLEEAALELKTLYFLIDDIHSMSCISGYDSGHSGICDLVEKDKARRSPK